MRSNWAPRSFGIVLAHWTSLCVYVFAFNLCVCVCAYLSLSFWSARPWNSFGRSWRVKSPSCRRWGSVLITLVQSWPATNTPRSKVQSLQSLSLILNAEYRSCIVYVWGHRNLPINCIKSEPVAYNLCVCVCVQECVLFWSARLWSSFSRNWRVKSLSCWRFISTA